MGADEADGSDEEGGEGRYGSEDSQDDGLFVMLGGDGRVFGTGDGIDYSFRAFQEFVPLAADDGGGEVTVEELIRDSMLVDSPLTDGATFWLGADAVDDPRCALEELAAAIFDFHTKDCEPDDYDVETSGIEWWVQSRPSLALHWDKDEEMRIAAGIFVHPHLSTVTYLTDGGAGRQAPTVVLDGRALVHYSFYSAQL